MGIVHFCTFFLLLLFIHSSFLSRTASPPNADYSSPAQSKEERRRPCLDVKFVKKIITRHHRQQNGRRSYPSIRQAESPQCNPATTSCHGAARPGVHVLPKRVVNVHNGCPWFELMLYLRELLLQMLSFSVCIIVNSST